MNAKLSLIYSQIPTSTCPVGCGKCCGILFPSLAEIRNIKDWCQQYKVGFKDFVIPTAVRTLTVGLDCPYLGQDETCTIYPVRPFLCRILGVSADLPCPLRACKPNNILNHFQSSYLYTQIYLRGKEKPRTEKHRRELVRLGLVPKRGLDLIKPIKT